MLKVRNKFADGMNEEDRGTRAREGTDAGERADDEESAARGERAATEASFVRAPKSGSFCNPESVCVRVQTDRKSRGRT